MPALFLFFLDVRPSFLLSTLFLSVLISCINLSHSYKVYILTLRYIYLITILLYIYIFFSCVFNNPNFYGIIVNSSLFFNLTGFFIEPFNFFFDKISLIFAITTLIIGFFSMGFTTFYLSGDKNILFFTKFLNIFILSMVFLVHTNSLVMLVFC